MKTAFRAIEDHELGDDGNRATGGPVHVSSVKYRYALSEAFIKAGEQSGLTRRPDLNTEEQEGVGYYCQNVKRGQRQSGALTFLQPAMRRRNVTVITGAFVERIVFTGRRAAAVEVRIGTVKRRFVAQLEIIVSCGAIESPKLLQLSGVGPAGLLSSLGIPIVTDSPDVGMGMREHLSFGTLYRLKGQAGINRELRGPGLIKNLFRYYFSRTGPMATGPFEAGAFVRSTPAAKRPDVQLYMGAFTFERSDDNFPIPFARVEREPGLTVFSQLLRCTSEGMVALRSPDPMIQPLIEPNWLATEHDQQSAVDAVNYVRRCMAQPAIASNIESELVPGKSVHSYEDIHAVYGRLSSSGLHGVATCRMGADNRAVLDERMRVRGVEGLRVVDCSAMPSPISGNTHGPAMALAWRAAELILHDAKTRIHA